MFQGLPVALPWPLWLYWPVVTDNRFYFTSLKFAEGRSTKLYWRVVNFWATTKCPPYLRSLKRIKLRIKPIELLRFTQEASFGNPPQLPNADEQNTFNLITVYTTNLSPLYSRPADLSWGLQSMCGIRFLQGNTTFSEIGTLAITFYVNCGHWLNGCKGIFTNRYYRSPNHHWQWFDWIERLREFTTYQTYRIFKKHPIILAMVMLLGTNILSNKWWMSRY